MRRSLRTMVAASAVASVAFGSLLAAPASQAASQTIVIWSDANRGDALKALFAGGYKGYSVQVVEKADIKADLLKVTDADAPDIIIGAHDWVGGLVANGSIVRINPSKAAIAMETPWAVTGFRYGTGIYGMPYSVENIAMVTNLSLVKSVPKTFAELSTTALALKKAGKVTVPFAVPGGNTYHYEPMLTGLGGEIFGTNPNGTFNPKKVGLFNPIFAKNTSYIDQWNKTGLLNSKVTYDVAKEAFKTGKSPFWITGAWELATIKALPFKYAITAVPAMIKGITPTPFLGAQGFMVTKYAATHGVQSGAASLVAEYIPTAAAQAKIYALSKDQRLPANIAANKTIAVKNPRLKAFQAAGLGGQPMPNIPQMDSVWDATNKAWTDSLAGASAVPAKKAWAQAQASVVRAIG